jgi:hypothetical protein
MLDEHGCLLLLFGSSTAAGLPAGAAERVRMGWERASLTLTPLPDGTTRGSLIANVDPKMPGDIEAPRWAVSWALRVLCPFIFNAACRLVGRIGQAGCIYRERMALNPELYDLVRQREAACRAALPPAPAAAAAPARAYEDDAEVEEAMAPPRRYMPSFLASAGF